MNQRQIKGQKQTGLTYLCCSTVNIICIVFRCTKQAMSHQTGRKRLAWFVITVVCLKHVYEFSIFHCLSYCHPTSPYISYPTLIDYILFLPVERGSLLSSMKIMGPIIQGFSK